jgi:PAS domain S-box-containing protein
MRLDAADILRALERGDIYPAFQPLVELKTGQVAGFEILARWQHEELGTILPDVFISEIEARGLSNRLTLSLLGKAFASIPLRESSLFVTVNLSPLQLQDTELPGLIAECARPSGFSLDRLMIEVTESALVDDMSRAKAVAGELKALGCSLALDDFGTGYSSLKHLESLPFDRLKVDRGFVSTMTEDRERRKIVAAVVGLGQSLGLLTVAEGIETQEQASMLLWLGCELGQGWLYGKPVPEAEIPRMLAVPMETFAAKMPAPLDGESVVGAHMLPAQRFAQLQAIYDGAPVGLCFIDKQLRYVTLNRQLAKLNGVPAAAHLGRTVAEVLPRLFPIVEPYIRRALRGESITGVEIQKPPADGGGEAQTLVLSYRPARDEAGEVLGVSVAIMDVTERKRTEQALHESEVHFRHMMTLGPHVPWVLNALGEVIEASPQWEVVTGQSLEEALGNGWQKMLHPVDVPPTQEAIRISLSTGKPIDISYRVRSPEGEWKQMRSRGAPRFGSAGEVVSVYGLVEEVEGEKQISEELRSCEAELRAAVDAVPVGVILADANDSTIFMVNPEAGTIFGGAVFSGQNISEFTPLGITDAEGLPFSLEENPLARAMQRGETTEPRIMFYRRADGKRIRITLSGKPIYADNRRLIGGLMIVQEMGSPE